MAGRETRGFAGSASAVALVIDTVVVDYAGVLTNPVSEMLAACARRMGLRTEDLDQAASASANRYGKAPMAALEVGEITVRQLVERLSPWLPAHATHVLDEVSLGELWFQGRVVNGPFVDFLWELKTTGYRLALLTNNVREWEDRWRAQLPVDELFELVVNSAHEGVRKPDPRIYHILFDRLDVTPAQCLFIDDVDENCVAAHQVGMRSLQFVETGSAVRAIREVLHGATHEQPLPVDARQALQQGRPGAQLPGGEHS